MPVIYSILYYYMSWVVMKLFPNGMKTQDSIVCSQLLLIVNYYCMLESFRMLCEFIRAIILRMLERQDCFGHGVVLVVSCGVVFMIAAVTQHAC